MPLKKIITGTKAVHCLSIFLIGGMLRRFYNEDGLVRFSTGIEDHEDLIADMQKALEALT